MFLPLNSTFVGLIFLIGEAAWLVFSIQANEKEIRLTEERGQKRYSRGMETAKDHEKRLREVEKYMNYLKGASK